MMKTGDKRAGETRDRSNAERSLDEVRYSLLRALDYQAISPEAVAIKNEIRAALDRIGWKETPEFHGGIENLVTIARTALHKALAYPTPTSNGQVIVRDVRAILERM
ncbi:MAG: hypothetical protein EPO02_13365 [Nitrospirae bacterium]|nr:MAG: hypothetical protein EPO02_13365 [Nitrospirota bacterium]